MRADELWAPVDWRTWELRLRPLIPAPWDRCYAVLDLNQLARQGQLPRPAELARRWGWTGQAGLVRAGRLRDDKGPDGYPAWIDGSLRSKWGR